MDEVEDDNWVREFDVSNPQKTHAGYTVYRISSKVYPKGFPEAASEVIVFKRYSEIRALYKELKIMYENKNVQKKKFPRFTKGHYFDRFDESVIEERQKQALSLLSFAGNISFLFTSQPFVKFFEGGVVHTSRASSRNSSDSDQAPDDTIIDTRNELEPWTPEIYFTEKKDSSDDETIYEITRDLSKTDLSLDIKTNETSPETGLEDDSMKTWLARAMSLCSEGDDIETLASEAGCSGESEVRNMKEICASTQEKDDDGDVVATASVVPSQGSVDMLPTLLESSDEEDVFVEIQSPRKSENSENVVEPDIWEETRCSQPLDNELSTVPSSEDAGNSAKDIGTDYGNIHPDGSVTKLDNYSTKSTSLNEEATSSDKECDVSETSYRQEPSSGENVKRHKQVGRLISNISMSWIDPKKKDYLYQAAQIIQQALYCEANDMYEEAFNKYKMCVGILLNGVQHDSDAKRREAVRRKTAQYLVKAEFLFNTYLKLDGKDIGDWSVKSQSTIEDITLRNVVDRQFGQLTLASLKVIGVIEKNMLVECEGLEGVYIMKVLHKTNAVHRSSRQENKQTNRGFSKKYVKSSHMVKLYRHFDTNDSIFLLLEYAAGGCLWNHAKSLRDRFYKREDTSSLLEGNTGLSRDTSSEATSHQHEPTPIVPERTSGEEPGLECLNTEEHDSKNSKQDAGSISNGEQTSDPSIGNMEASNSTTKHGNNASFEHKTCLTASETCLNKDQASSEHTRTFCDVLGFLDHGTKDHSVLDKCIQRWIAELLLAIDSLHSCGLILKDLKPLNVLLDADGRVVLSYFGVWEEVDHSADPKAVEEFYCAPEICRGEKITFAADWWTLGALSYELLTGKTLYSAHPWGIYPHSSIIFPSEDISTEARSLLSGLICHNVRERLGSGIDGVDGIKSHAFFQGVDWNELEKAS